MNANGLYSGVEGYVIPGTNSGVGGGVANGVYGEVSDSFIYDLKTPIFWLDSSNNVNVQGLQITSWTDRISKVRYVGNAGVGTPIIEPQDSSFNNYPVVSFNTTSLGLYNSNGPSLNRNRTLVMVYQYISPSANSGLSRQSRVISDGDESNARSSGFAYCWDRNNNGIILGNTGYYNPGNNNPAVGSVSLYNTTRYIIVVNTNLWLANNQSVLINQGGLTGIPTFNINAIGGATGFSGVFKLAELLLYDYTMDFTQASFISNRLNSKYLIY